MTTPPTLDPSVTYRELDVRFEAALEACLDGAQGVSLLFSGGVDSCLLASALGDRPGAELVALSVPSGRDLELARSGARLLGLDVRLVSIGDSDVERAFRLHRSDLADRREPRRSVQVSLSLGFRAAKEPRVLAGQGADELFGGYSHFRGLSAVEAERRRSRDLARLLEDDWPLSQQLASHYGRTLRSPFLEEPFYSFASRIPLEPVGPNDLTKPFLRRWAVHRGVPEPISLRPKLAIQYGSGVERVLRRLLNPGRVRVRLESSPDRDALAFP